MLIDNIKKKKRMDSLKKRQGQKLDADSMLFHVGNEDISETNHKFEKLKLAEMACLSLSMSGFICSVCVVLAQTYMDQSSLRNTVLSLLLVSSSMTTIALLYAVYWRAQKELKWQKAKMMYSSEDDLRSTKKVRILFLELLLNAIHPAFGLHEVAVVSYIPSIDASVTYSLISIISIIMMLRVYHVIRFISSMSRYRTSRCQRLCKIYGVVPSNWFALKCMVHEMPIKIITWMFILSLFMAAYAIFILETPTFVYGCMDFTKFGNAIWYVIVTMATVGYGDYYPVTTTGRVVGFLASLCGIIIVSLTTLTFSNFLNLELGEEVSLKILERLSFKQEVRQQAAWVLTSAVRHQQLCKRFESDSKDVANQFGKFRNHLNKFHTLRKQQKNLYDFDSYTDRIEMKLLDIIDMNDKALEYNAKSLEIIEFFQRQPDNRC